MLKNLTDEEDNYSLEIKNFKMMKAEVQEIVEINNNRTCIAMRPHELKMIRITVEK